MPRRPINISTASDDVIHQWAGGDLLDIFQSPQARDLVLGPIVLIAKAVVPVLTGRLRDSIRQEGPYVIADARDPRNNFNYALRVELTNTPFLRIALNTANIQLARFNLREFVR